MFQTTRPVASVIIAATLIPIYTSYVKTDRPERMAMVSQAMTLKIYNINLKG